MEGGGGKVVRMTMMASCGAKEGERERETAGAGAGGDEGRMGWGEGGRGGGAHSIPIDIELKPPATTKSQNCCNLLLITHVHRRAEARPPSSKPEQLMLLYATCDLLGKYFDIIMVIILMAMLFRFQASDRYDAV